MRTIDSLLCILWLCAAAGAGCSTTQGRAPSYQGQSGATAHVDEQVEPAEKVKEVVKSTEAASPFTAEFRIDMATGGLSRTLTEKTLLAAKSQIESCTHKGDFSSVWTVVLRFDIEASGKAKVDVEGAPEAVTRCLVQLAQTLAFSAADSKTTVESAIMIEKKASTPLVGLGTIAEDDKVWGPAAAGTPNLFGKKGVIGGIQRGSGTISRGAVSPRPSVVWGPFRTSSNALDTAIIRRHLRRKRSQIRFCYEMELLRTPKLAGTVLVKFTIRSNGKVKIGLVIGVSPTVASCTLNVLQGITFPNPKGGKEMVVRFPIVFSMTSGNYGQLGNTAPIPPVIRAGKVKAGPALSKEVIKRVMKKNVPRIQYCYEKELLHQPKLQGRIEVKYTIGTNGRVSQTTVKGLTPAMTSCIEKVLKKMQFPKPIGGGVVVVRYPFVLSTGP